MQYEITPLFSTPLLKTHLGALDPITLAWMKKLDYPSSAVASYSGEEELPLTERGFNVLNQPKLQGLKTLIEQAVHYFAHTVLDVVDDVDFTLTTSWINKMNTGSDIVLHNHANAVISGVYYPDVGPTSNPLTFKKNRQHLNSFPEHVRPDTKGNYNQYNIGAWTVQPITGDCLIFPSHLEHEVAQSLDKQDRYSLAFNYFPKGSLGQNSVRVNI
jgi:uncharacterized protein (TIGR02466 family)